MLECAELNNGMSPPKGPRKPPGLREAKGVGPACQHLDAWASTPQQSAVVSGATVTQSEDQSPSGTGTVCAQSQGCGWIEDPSKKKL